MRRSKYIKLDQNKIREDFPHVYERWELTHKIEAVLGVEVDLRKLAENESVLYGDGKSFHFKLTKEPLKLEKL